MAELPVELEPFKDDLHDVFSDYLWGKAKEVFEIVESEIVDYNEGCVTTSYVVKHKESGKFFSATTSFNSWDDWVETDDIEVDEVFPTEKTITVYVTKDKL